MTPEQKRKIDSMSRLELASRWRHAPLGDALLQGDSGKYFQERFSSLGGMSPEISKQIGW